MLFISLAESGSELAAEGNATDIVTSADFDFVVHGVPDANAATLSHAAMVSNLFLVAVA